MAKQIAPPKVTGGGGFVFEDKVAAYFLACLLSGQPPLDPSLGLLSRVDFQTRVDRWFLDDLLLTLVFSGDTRRCALSVKSNQQFTTDAAPHDFVTLAWEQFLQEGTTHFRRDRDLLGLVVTTLPQKLAEGLPELLSWAQMQAPESLPDRLTAPGFASELKRRLFRSFACPEELAAKHGIRDQNIGELLRCIRVVSFDFEHDASTRLQSAVGHCRSVLRSGALEEAVSLWERLLAIANEYRPRAGYLDLPRLLEQVRSGFQLKDYPDHRADWVCLHTRMRENLTTLPDKIGNAVSLPREQELAALETAYSETRFVVLLGPSGCGKTVIAKAWAERKLQAHKVLWWNAGSFDVRDFATFEATLNLRYPLQELLETVPDALAYTVIDGLDRVFSGAAFQNLSVCLQKLCLEAETSPWHVLITCQPEEWERIRLELARVNAPLAKWRAMEIKEPRADDLAPVWNAFPALQHLALHPNLQPLLFKPKVLDLLASRLSIGGAVDTREWVGESDLIQWFWNTEVRKAPNETIRSHFLMSLGEKQADDLRAETPLDTFSHSDLVPLEGLCQDRICKQHEERLSFLHDLYGDWARQRKLLQQADLRSYLESRLSSPLWHRAVRLYGLYLLEQDRELIRWKTSIQALATEDKAGNLAQDLLLESVIFAAQPLRLLERLWPDLAANGGLFLRRLLGRFLHVATLPNPMVTALTKAMSLDLETEAATLYRIPYWPYWLPMIQFLYNHRAEVIQLAPQHVAEIAGTWLQRGHETWVLRREAAELALTLAEPILRSRQSGRFVDEDKLVKSAYRAALAAARELPERVATFALEACARREPPQQASPNETGAGALSRQTLLAIDIGASLIGEDYATPWPDGPRESVDANFRDICLEEHALISLIATASSVAREVLLALLIEPPTDDNPLLSRVRLNDNFEIEDMIEWYPPFYMRGPFLSFLHMHPAEGLEVILRLVNFATERWAARWVGQEPPGVTIPLSGGEARWIGNHALYYWYRAYPHCPHPVAVALMALEKWLYDAIDAQESIHELLNTLLQQSRSIAFAGLLSAIVRKEPSLFEGILQPLLVVPEFHYWELWYSSQLDQDMLPMIGWEDQGTLFIKLARDWHTLPHRRNGLHEWAHHLFLNVSQMRSFFERVRLQWTARLQAVEEGDRFKDYLEKLIAQYDIKNYEVQSHPEHGEVWQFIPPESLRVKSEKFQKDTEEERLLLYFPIRCRQILEAGQPLSPDSLEQFWDLLQRISQFMLPTNDDSEGGRIEDAICGGAAVLLKFHRQWLQQHPVWEEWCVQQFLTTIRNPPKAGRHYHENAGVTRKWEQFCAQVLPLLWAEDPNSPVLRECIALLASSHYYKTVEFLFAAIAEHRQHLGAHFKQLQHFLLRWAAARWKWQRFLYKEETRLELEKSRQREIQAFVTQSITAEVPHWEEIVAQMQSRQVSPPKYVKGRRGIKKIRSQQDSGLDLPLIQSAYGWLPALDQAVSESERAEWISFWKEALDCLLRRLGADTADEEEISGTPYEVDHWVLRRIAGLITQLRHAERPADFWGPIFVLGTPGHFWVQTFLREWFVCGLLSEPASDAFVCEWRAMLEYAFASQKWSFESGKRWFKLEEMWCALMGFDRIICDMWTVSHKPVVKCMYKFYERWADRHLHRPRCAQAFIAFLTQPAAEEIFLDGLVWLEKAARQSGDRFWNEHRLSEALVSLLDMCWRSHKERLRQQEVSFSAFKTLLKKLADFQNPMALEIQQRVVSVNGEPG